MLKLVVSDGTLSINDGDMILSRWTTESHFGKVFVKDAFGFPIEESKMPIETQEGIRTDAADVIADIGANFKGIDFSYYYEWIMTGKPNEIEALEAEGYGYKNYGTGEFETKISNTPIIKLDGISNTINTKKYIIGQEDVNISIEYELEAFPTSTVGLFNCGADCLKAYMVVNNTNLYLRVGNDSTGTLFVLSNSKIGKNSFEMVWDGKTGSNIYVKFNNIEYNKTAIDSWVGNSVGTFIIGAFVGTALKMAVNIHSFSIENIFKSPIIEGSKNLIYNTYGGDAAEIAGTVVWSGSSIKEPLSLTTYSYTLYQLLSNPKEYLRVVYANSEPQTINETLYAKVGEFAPNTGFTNTGNTIIQPSGDANLFALSQKYKDLNFMYDDVDTPNEGTFEDYRSINNNVIVVKLGDYIYIRTVFNSTQDLVQKWRLMDIAFDNSLVMPITTIIIDNTNANTSTGLTTGVFIHNTSDDICPSNYNGTYIGGNHGANFIHKITATAHGKTNEDVGSEWLDGLSHKFYIVRIVDVNTIWILSENIGTAELWQFYNTINGTTLTHSENATHTTDITIESSVLTQLEPAVKKITQQVLIDGDIDITDYDDGLVFISNHVDIIDINEIINPASVLDNLIVNVGSSSEPDFTDGTSQLRNEITYRFIENGACTVYYDNWELLQNITIGYMGFIQSLNLNETVTYPDQLLYIPKSLPISDGVKTWDFKNVELFEAPATSLYFSTTYWEDINNPPERSVKILRNESVENSIAFSSGYSLINGEGKNMKDLTDTALFISSNSKLYPQLINDKITPIVGDSYSVVAYRHYNNVADLVNATSFMYYQEYDKIIIIADYHKSIVNDKLIMPNKYVGKTITVIDKDDNLTLNSTTIESDGIDITVVNDYGYIVMSIDYESELKIPEDDLRFDLINGVIKNWAAQPYEPVTKDGEIVTYLGEKVTSIKTHLIT